MKKWKKILCVMLTMTIWLCSSIPAMAHTADLCIGGTPIGNMLNVENAFDDNSATFASSYSKEHENRNGDTRTLFYGDIGYDFGAAKKIRYMQVLCGKNVPATFYYGDKADNWVEVSTVTLNSVGRNTYEFPDVGAHRYWKIRAYTDIYELEMKDIAPPTLTITSPTANSGYNNQPGNYTILLKGIVDSPCTSVSTYYDIDGGETHPILGSVNSSGGFTDTFIDISGATASGHTLNVWAINGIGQKSAITSIPFSFNVVSSAITIASPSVNKIYSGKSPYNTLSLSGTVSNPGWISTMYYNIDGGASQTGLGTVNGIGAFQTLQINPLTLTEAIHTLNFWSVDNRNRTSNMVSIQFKIDFTGPAINAYSAIPSADGLNIYVDASDSSGVHNTDKYRATISAVGSGTIVSEWKPVAPITLATLNPDTLYTIKVEAQDSVGNISEKTFTKYTPAQIPVLEVVNGSGTAEIKVTDRNPISTKYKIMSGSKFVDQNGVLTASPTWISLPTSKKIIVSGLNGNLGYGFRASAMGADGIETELSDTRIISPVAPPPTAPTLLRAMAKINESTKNNEITIYWDPVIDATGYTIEVDGVEMPTNNGIKTEYTQIISGVKPSTHRYRVKTLRDTTSSPWSEYISTKTLVAPPTAPSNLNITPYATSAVLSWETVTGATSYELLLDGVVKDAGYKLTYTNKHLSPDTIHTYAVRAKNGAGASPWTELKVIRTTSKLPAAPVINYNKATNSQITIAWNDVADAEGYDVEFDGVVSNCGIYNYCLRTNLEPRKTYTFRARAKNAIGESAWSEPITVSTYFLNTSECITAVEEDVKINLGWKPVAGAERYVISINGMETDVGQVLKYTLENLTMETEYKIKLKAVNSTGTGGWTDELRVSTLPKKPEKPKRVTSLVLPNYVSLYWDNVLEASGYDVELDGVIIDNDKDTIYIDEALEPNTNHIFRIRAKNIAIEGDWSDSIKVTTMPEAPKAPSGIKILTSKNLANISWAKIIGAQGYEIEVDGANIISLGDNNTYVHRRLAEVSEHRYRIRSRFVNETSPWSGEIINNSILALCKKNATVDLGLTAQDVSDFSKYTLTVTYDPNAMDVVDLCTLSSSVELKEGKVKGTDIQIKEFTPGKIIFLTNKVVNPGESWTGVINSIKFKAKVSGRTSITYTVYSAPEDEE